MQLVQPFAQPLLGSLCFLTISTMQLPAFHSQQALTSHQRHSSCPHIPIRNHRASRRQLVVAAGEARSANRTKWTQKEHQQGYSSQKQQQYASNITQLTQLDDAHDLVGEGAWQQ